MSDLGLSSDIPGLDNEPEYSEFAQGVLNGIPEQDRTTVGKYIKDWDGNVTKKFQSIHEEYKPYKDLGPIEDVQSALQYIGLLNDDPVQFINIIQEAMRENGMMNDEDDDKVTAPSTDLFDGVPPAFVEQFKSLQSTVEKLNGNVQADAQSRQEKEDLAALDKLLGNLHNTHGDFDEDWVLMQMTRGISPEDAVSKFQSDIVQKYSSPKKPPASIISGSGQIPSGQADLSKMSKAEKMAYAVKRLTEANSQ